MFSFSRPVMNGYINSGVTLIVDRYVYSGVAFSAAKQVSFYIFHYVCHIVIYVIHYKLRFAVLRADLEISEE
jgi:thymidylate kinase